MIYTSFEDMANCIRRNLWKVPADVDLIVGVPRSGMIAAMMVAEFLNKRVTDIDSFIAGHVMDSGGRGRMIRNGIASNILVIDDTVYSGGAMQRAKDKLKPLEDSYHILYGCIYAEGKGAKNKVDIYFEENYTLSGGKLYLYEWNILHHYPSRTKYMMWDMDGIICKDPPDDANTAAYEAYLPNAVPMIIPTIPIEAICTYRLEKYRKVTEEWLKRNGIEVKQVIMFNASTREERNAISSPGYYKGKMYKEAKWAKLFIESEEHQAEKIHRVSGKPVFCYSNGRMYI